MFILSDVRFDKITVLTLGIRKIRSEQNGHYENMPIQIH